MKTCTSCKEEKSYAEFHANKAKSDGHQSQCKACRRVGNAAYYQSSKSRQAEKRKANKCRLLERNRQIVLMALKSGCVDCGTMDIRVLEFDHVADDKSFTIGRMMEDVGEMRLLREIAKCEVVCANCHKIRTCERLGSWRSKLPSQLNAGSNPVTSTIVG